MNLPDRKWLRHGTPDWVQSDNEVFFLTVCAMDRRSNVLIEETMANRLVDSVRERHGRGIWWVHLFLVMPDHVHGLLSFPRSGAGMKGTVASWKRWTARNLNVQWQQGFFDHRLRGTDGFEEKAHYVRMNPVRAGLVPDFETWPHVWPR